MELPVLCTEAEESIIWMNCHPATSFPNALSALGFSLVPRTDPIALAYPTASIQMMTLGSGLPRDWPTGLGHTSQQCGRVKAPALAGIVQPHPQKFRGRGRRKKNLAGTQGRGLKEGLSLANLSLVAHVPCTYKQVSLECPQEWDH